MKYIRTMRSTQNIGLGSVFCMECSVGFRLVFLGALLFACGRSHEFSAREVGDPDAGAQVGEVLDGCAERALLVSDATTRTPQLERVGSSLWVRGGHGEGVLLDAATLEPIEVPEGNIVGRDPFNRLFYVLQPNRLHVWDPEGLRMPKQLELDTARVERVQYGPGGAWVCVRGVDDPSRAELSWFDVWEGTVSHVGAVLNCSDFSISLVPETLVFENLNTGEPTVSRRGETLIVGARPSDYESEETRYIYEVSADGQFIVRLIKQGTPGYDTWLPEFDVFSTRTGSWLTTSAWASTPGGVSIRVHKEDQATVVEHDHGATVVRVTSDKAIVEDLPGEAFVASEGAHLYTWRADHLLLRIILSGKPLAEPRVVFEGVELAQLRSQNTRLVTSSGGSLILHDGTMRIITDSGSSLTDVKTGRYPQLVMLGEWSATSVVAAKWKEDESGYSRRVFLDDGAMVRELSGLHPAVESNERIITREGDRLFIWNPQSGNETTLGTFTDDGPIELFALEDRDELVIAQGCLEPGTEHNNLGPIYHWSFSKVELPMQRFENGGS